MVASGSGFTIQNHLAWRFKAILRLVGLNIVIWMREWSKSIEDFWIFEDFWFLDDFLEDFLLLEDLWFLEDFSEISDSESSGAKIQGNPGIGLHIVIWVKGRAAKSWRKKKIIFSLIISNGIFSLINQQRYICSYYSEEIYLCWLLENILSLQYYNSFKFLVKRNSHLEVKVQN